MNQLNSIIKSGDIVDDNEYLEANMVPNIKSQIDTSKEQISDTLKFPFVNQVQNGEEFSLMDYNNFRLNYSEIQLFIKEHFRLDIEKSKDIQKLNMYFQDAIDICKERYRRKVPSSIRDKKITKNNIVDILSKTGKGRNGVYYCILSKILFAHGKTIADARISGINGIHENIDSFIKQQLQIEQREGLYVSIGTTGDNKVPIRYSTRPKLKSSVTAKTIGNIDYKSIDDFYDLHGFTIEMNTSNDIDIVSAIQTYYFSLINNPDIEDNSIKFESKNLISLESLNNLKKQSDSSGDNFIDEGFYHFLASAIFSSQGKSKNKVEGGKGVNKNYSDGKFKFKMKTDNPEGKNKQRVISGVELKFTRFGNQNEDGLAMHSIFDYKKRFRELNRLGSYIRQKDIIHFVNDFFKNLDDVLKFKGKNRYDYYNELLQDLIEKGYIDQDTKILDNALEKKLALGIYKEFLTDLIPIEQGIKGLKKIYYVHKDYLKHEKAGIKPELKRAA